MYAYGSDHYISTNFKKTLWGTISDFPDFYISSSTRCKYTVSKKFSSTCPVDFSDAITFY